MTSDGSPYARLKRALELGNLLLVRATAAELGWITLPDALAILELIEEHEEERFDAAAVRWVGRLALEAPGVTLAQLGTALAALEALPDTEAQVVLRALAREARSTAPPGAAGRQRRRGLS
jgi:hypothetical protein